LLCDFGDSVGSGRGGVPRGVRGRKKGRVSGGERDCEKV